MKLYQSRVCGVGSLIVELRTLELRLLQVVEVTGSGRSEIILTMANRARTLDPEVFSINDLKEKASKKLPKMYRGECSVRPGL